MPIKRPCLAHGRVTAKSQPPHQWLLLLALLLGLGAYLPPSDLLIEHPGHISFQM